MSSSDKTTMFTNVMIVLIILYCITKILEFYGINSDTYGVYLTFYLFLYLASFALPTNYTNINTRMNV
jgi:hypothetical protein